MSQPLLNGRWAIGTTQTDVFSDEKSTLGARDSFAGAVKVFLHKKVNDSCGGRNDEEVTTSFMEVRLEFLENPSATIF